MDKVIIDGIDVSECDFRLVRDGNQKCECCHATGFGVICDCEMWKTCYYKQLKRLQAEYDDLHLSYAGCKTANTGLQELNEKLQAENERLKKQYNCYACDSCGGKEDYINMKRHTENAIKTVHKYRQALQEIRNIAKEWMTDYCYLDSFYEKEGCCICHENKDCYSYRLLKALTKAEEENE